MNPFATATELLADLRAGRVTASELTEMYIGRIEKHDARLNAVVERDVARARDQARVTDRGGCGALRGLPIALKESLNVSGLRTTLPRWKDFVSQHDAPAWARLGGAGAVLLGKTNVPRGPHADPVRGVPREGDRRVHEAAGLRRVTRRLGPRTAGEPGAAP